MSQFHRAAHPNGTVSARFCAASKCSKSAAQRGTPRVGITRDWSTSATLPRALGFATQPSTLYSRAPLIGSVTPRSSASSNTGQTCSLAATLALNHVPRSTHSVRARRRAAKPPVVLAFAHAMRDTMSAVAPRLRTRGSPNPAPMRTQLTTLRVLSARRTRLTARARVGLCVNAIRDRPTTRLALRTRSRPRLVQAHGWFVVLCLGLGALFLIAASPLHYVVLALLCCLWRVHAIRARALRVRDGIIALIIAFLVVHFGIHPARIAGIHMTHVLTAAGCAYLIVRIFQDFSRHYGALNPRAT